MIKSGMVKVGGFFLKEDEDKKITYLKNKGDWESALRLFRSLTGVSAGRAKAILGYKAEENTNKS